MARENRAVTPDRDVLAALHEAMFALGELSRVEGIHDALVHLFDPQMGYAIVTLDLYLALKLNDFATSLLEETRQAEAARKDVVH